MLSSVLHFMIVNAFALAFAVAVVSLLLFFLLNYFGKGLLGALFAVLTALLYVLIPLFGGYLTLVTGVMACFIKVRQVWLAITVVGINILNVLMFSTLLRANAAGGIQVGDYKWAVFFIGLAVFQVAVGLAVFFRYMEKKKEADLMEPVEYIEEEEERTEPFSHPL
ncbi:MAG: hypothetical protein HQL67_02135 [Magnetococcales bacterium]|nr:hypothetical protein [Magnetococcales bacterium]